VSRFIYNYAECHYAECSHAESRYAECSHAECHAAHSARLLARTVQLIAQNLNNSPSIRKDCFQNKYKFITEDHFTKHMKHCNSLIKSK